MRAFLLPVIFVTITRVITPLKTSYETKTNQYARVAGLDELEGKRRLAQCG